MYNNSSSSEMEFASSSERSSEDMMRTTMASEEMSDESTTSTERGYESDTSLAYTEEDKAQQDEMSNNIKKLVIANFKSRQRKIQNNTVNSAQKMLHAVQIHFEKVERIKSLPEFEREIEYIKEVTISLKRKSAAIAEAYEKKRADYEHELESIYAKVNDIRSKIEKRNASIAKRVRGDKKHKQQIDNEGQQELQSSLATDDKVHVSSIDPNCKKMYQIMKAQKPIATA